MKIATEEVEEKMTNIEIKKKGENDWKVQETFLY